MKTIKSVENNAENNIKIPQKICKVVTANSVPKLKTIENITQVGPPAAVLSKTTIGAPQLPTKEARVSKAPPTSNL